MTRREEDACDSTKIDPILNEGYEGNSSGEFRGAIPF